MMSDRETRVENEREKPITSRIECMFCGSDYAVFNYYAEKQAAGFFCPDCGRFVVYVEADAVLDIITGKRGDGE